MIGKEYQVLDMLNVGKSSSMQNVEVVEVSILHA